MMKSIFAAAGLAAAVSAFTQPTSQTYGALLTPNTDSPVTTGQDYTVTWEPKSTTDGATVSLVLCNGPGANCVLQSAAIQEKIPAASGSYTWSVPCSLPEGVASTATGYGMLIIVDGTGEFQYSNQFSVHKGASCSSSGSTSTTTTSSSGSVTSSVSGKPVSQTTSDGWYGWSSGFNTTTTPAYTATSVPAVTTSASASYTKVSTTGSATTAATPSPFTGAAAIPTAFVNAAGLIGAAGLAMLAL